MMRSQSLVLPPVHRFNTQRFLSVKNARIIQFEKFGKPEEVLSVKTVELPNSLGKSEVLVKMVAAPINPADINLIEGVYGTKPTVPAVAGSEGMGIVVEKGNDVHGLNLTDHVIPVKAAGTWCTHAIYKEKDLLKIPKDIPKEYAATLSSPSTAIRLLEDFVSLQSGDVIVQNGANSMVGSAIFQIANARGIKSINIIRNRPDFPYLVEKMKALGGHIVVSEDYLVTSQFKRLVADLPKPKLALNCVGGSTATEMTRLLGEHGVMVNYGAMAHRPVTVATSQFIFNDLTLKGFWLNRWLDSHSLEDRKKMLESIYDVYRADKLKLWMETWKFDKFPDALDRHNQKFRDRKVVITMDE